MKSINSKKPPIGSGKDALYWHYWGKAKKSIEVDYCLSNGSDKEIARRYGISLEALKRRVAKNQWKKVKPGGNYPAYHLLPYHSLDVAAVGYLLLDPQKPLCQHFAAQLKVEPKWLQAWFCFCLMLHDLGKFCRAFQNLAPDLSPKLVPYDSHCVYDTRHDTLGFVLWQKVLNQKLNKQIPVEYARTVESWLEIVCGHHGKPPENLRSIKPYLLEEDGQAAEQFVLDVTPEWLCDLTPLQKIDIKDFKRVSWQLAGVAVLADWLGSNQSIFNYCVDLMPLKTYWSSIALPRSCEAIAQAKLGERKINPFVSIKQQFNFIENLTPLQNYAQTVQLGKSSQLFILEDVTGAGKTEAAMVLVHRLMAANLANGVYVGLPTMATANAMYQRMAKSYRGLYHGEDTPSLVLAHGTSQLSEAFNESVALSQQMADKNYEPDELSASAYCNQWLADNRKKALLADVGVGTIDQALLGVLPARHQSLRLLGLTNKVLLVDEVHAFDPYMRRVLSALLQAHAIQGGCAILLSATLPYRFREELVSAYAQGANINPPAISAQARYPWVTQLNRDGLFETPVTTRKSVQRRIVVQRLSDEGEAHALIKRAVELGQCVCWIRNTVKDARNAYQQLQQQSWITSEKLTLFHSRYAMIDRQVIEKDVLRRFGKMSKGYDREGQILIATQVVEQSLDLDFDLMISDLAPIDLLIQRAGRLQRHIRTLNGDCVEGDDAKEQREPPCLYILTPDPQSGVDQNWLRVLLPGTQAVYPNVGQLWLTINTLLENKGFAMPDDARHLIESVYGDNAQANIPAELEQASNQALAEQRAQHGMGEFNRLKLEKGYTLASAGHSGGWDEEVRIPTRLGGDTVTVVLVKRSKNKWVAYADVDKHKWALSQINLPRAEWEQVSRLIPQSLQDSLERFKESEVGLRWLELMPLVDETNGLYAANGGWYFEKQKREQCNEFNK